MDLNDYIKVFILGRGKEKISAKKMLAKINCVTVIDNLDYADYLYLPHGADALSQKEKEELEYAKELGINVLTSLSEIEKQLGKTNIKMIMKEDFSEEMEI